ncbi:fungal-specific transcription factor domain-containing protein [Aspergillus pseudoustus]|uniref:Fungal-specific transcription factor domain-containing protein n=1 Tax=Aspergillus pseudoustus TaxID=1810923 RepID=A0ABR4IX63_9EURO
MGKELPTSPEESPSQEGASPSPKQRRTRSRVACDACHSQHARCDLVFPCSRCLRKGIQCGCRRELRKRGRIPKRMPHLDDGTLGGKGDADNSEITPPEAQFMISPAPSDPRSPGSSQQSSSHSNEVSVLSSSSVECPQSLGDMVWPIQGSKKDVKMDDPFIFQHSSADYVDLLIGTALEGGSFPLEPFTPTGFQEYSSPRHAESETEFTATLSQTMSSLRYPVLRPLLPFIEPHIPGELACGLLDLYFTSAFPEHMHPVCHHIHCYVVRKASFLETRDPRPTSPALLASMLWVAASDDRAFCLPISPHYRKQIGQFLYSLVVHLLKPLPYTPSEGPRKTASGNPTFPFTDFTSPLFLAHPPSMTNNERGIELHAGTIDDVIAYIHIASIFSASEQKALSMRWWYAAFALARELKLNQEIKPAPVIDIQNNCFSGMDTFPDDFLSNQRILNCACNDSTTHITEEQREERRRVWWLLYIMDRHLALCDNRPLILLDSECSDLLLPLDESAWQAGEIHSNSRNFTGPQCLVSGHRNMRREFPDFTCHDQSIFGFFLPLMVIMGQVVDLSQMKTHPILGAGTLGKETLQAHRDQVLLQLSIYEASLGEFIARASSVEDALPPWGPHQPTAHSQSQIYWISHTVAAYASYYVHVLHILLTESWDPVTLTDDKVSRTSSLSFASAISRALKAAESVNLILKFDPDISFMPDFFGVQLLQGGFHFLLIIERLQDKADEAFLGACEVMIRATESCLVTLNTEYQRNFCQVMRSAVAQARGRPVNFCEIQRRHRAILALHRWTGTGTGLAL